MNVALDPYPTRFVDVPMILPRIDPVIWARKLPAGHPFTRHDVDRFERDGFLFVPGFFGEHAVRRFREELDRVSAFCAEHYPDEAFMEPEAQALRSLFRVQRFSEVFADVACDPRIVDFVRALLDDDVYLHQTRVNYKPAFQGKEFFWHSDFETWHAEDGMPAMRAISASIVLTPNNEFNGPLMLLPGSHRHFVSCVGETPEGHYRRSLVRQEIGVPDARSLRWLVDRSDGIRMPTGPAGSLLLFDCNTMHGSNSNISPFSRSNLFFVYNAVSNRMVAPFAASAPRPEFLAARERIVPIH